MRNKPNAVTDPRVYAARAFTRVDPSTRSAGSFASSLSIRCWLAMRSKASASNGRHSIAVLALKFGQLKRLAR